MNSTHDKTITLLLRHFLKYSYLNTYDKITIDLDDAYLFQAADKEEQFIHVEIPSADNGLEHPRLWNIRDWRTHYEEYIRKKKQYEHDRKEANLLTENTERLSRAIAKKFGLPVEFVRASAYKIAKKKDDCAASNFDVKIDKGE